MSDGTLEFTGQENALASLGNFKAHVLHNLGLREVFSMQSNEDWASLLSEVRQALTDFKTATLYSIDHGISKEKDVADNIDVARGKLKPIKPTTTATIGEIETAIREQQAAELAVQMKRAQKAPLRHVSV